MRFFKLRYSHRIRTSEYNSKICIKEAARILKFFHADYISIENNRVVFDNSFHWFQTLMTPIDGGFFEIAELANGKIKLTYQFRFDRIGYPFFLIILAVSLITRNLTSISYSFIIIAIGILILIITQWYIFYELVNAVKLEVK